MDSMGSSFKLCFSRGTAIAQDFRPRELACFVIFAYFCYRNLDTYNYWYILILLLETQGHETSPHLQQKLDLCSLLPLWSGLVSLSIEFSGGHFWCGSDWFCTCPLQTPRFSAVSTKGRSTVQGLWTRPPTGTKRAWDPVQRRTVSVKKIWRCVDGHGSAQPCCLENMGNENNPLVNIQKTMENHHF